MSTLTLDQALANAIAAEEAAAAFYRQLVSNAGDREVAALFTELAVREVAHANSVRYLVDQLLGGQLDATPDDRMELVESAPAWTYVEGLDLDTAVAVAEECEVHAANYYEAMADATVGQVQLFFAKMATDERSHARNLETLASA